MSRQIPLIGYIGDVKQDGGYDVTVKTADGITVGKYEMDAQGQPITPEGAKYQVVLFTGSGITFDQNLIVAKVGESVEVVLSSSIERFDIVSGADDLAAVGLAFGTGADKNKIVGTIVDADVPTTIVVEVAEH